MEGQKDKKKIIILLIIAVLFFAVLVWFSLQKNDTPEKSVAPDPSADGPAKSLLDESVPSTTGVVSPDKDTDDRENSGWKKYSNQYFTINYPQDYVLSDGVFPGGTLTTFSKNDTKVLVQTTSDPKMKTAEIVARYISTEYKTAPIKIGNISATFVEGSLNNGFAEKGYIFDINGRTYRIIYMYSTSQSNLARDDILDEMMATLSLK